MTRSPSLPSPPPAAPRRARGTAWALAGLLVVAGVGGATLPARSDSKKAQQEQQKQQERLHKLGVELDKKRAALKDLDNKERSLLTTLGELDQALAELETEQTRARRHVELLEAERANLQDQLTADQKAYADVEVRLHKRLRALYVLGEGGALRHLLGAGSFEDLAYRRRLVRQLADSDTRLVAEHVRIRTGLAEKRAALRRAVDNAKGIEAELLVQAKALEDTKKERKVAIARIEQEKELGVRRVEEIVGQQKEVRALLQKLSSEAQRSGRKPSGSRLVAGGLTSPVAGAVLRGFGVTKDKTSGAKLVSNGLHIKAKLGAPVAAPGDGRVSFVGWLRGFGQLVIIEHADGVHSLLAHLSRAVVQKNDAVTKGQTVGFVGDTESTEGPKLYLELRKNGRPINPQPYLK